MADEKKVLLADLCDAVIKHNNGIQDKRLLSQKITNIFMESVCLLPFISLCHNLTKLVSGPGTKESPVAFVGQYHDGQL